MGELPDTSARDRLDLLDQPTYTLAESSRLVGVSKGRVRRWLQGYEYTYEIARGSEFREGRQEPVVHKVGSEGTSYASFLDLIDLLFVRRFLDHGLSLQLVRKALDEAAEFLGTAHFAREIFFTDGRRIYLQMRGRGENILQLMSCGQWVIAPIIESLSDKIDFHTVSGYAERWYPLGKKGLVVIDPYISFGRPSIIGRGTATANIYDLYCGEKGALRDVAKWMGISRPEAKAAVSFELQLAA